MPLTKQMEKKKRRYKQRYNADDLTTYISVCVAHLESNELLSVRSRKLVTNLLDTLIINYYRTNKQAITLAAIKNSICNTFAIVPKSIHLDT